MGKILDECQAFKEGSVTWDDLLAFLNNTEFADPPAPIGVEDDAQSAGQVYPAAGTWQEVEAAVDRGFLTPAEYDELLGVLTGA